VDVGLWCRRGCGFDGASVGVGLMVVGFVVPAWVWLRLWEKKKKKNNCFYNILIEYIVK
jgi:hypothetical protein